MKCKICTISILIAFLFVFSPTVHRGLAQESELILSPGEYIIGADIEPGWYRLSYVDGEYSSAYVYTHDAVNIDSVLWAYFCWYADDGAKYPAEAVPLITGCLVVVGDMNDGRPDDSTGTVRFELIQPFSEQTPLPSKAVSFSVAAGEYICGVDFPAGAYSITVSDSAHYDFINYDITDASGRKVFAGVIHREDGGGLGKVEFEEGWIYSAEEGPSFFEPYTGISFK